MILPLGSGFVGSWTGPADHRGMECALGIHPRLDPVSNRLIKAECRVTTYSHNAANRLNWLVNPLDGNQGDSHLIESRIIPYIVQDRVQSV